MDKQGMGELARRRQKAGHTQASLVAEFAREAARLGVNSSLSVRQLRRWETESPPPLPHPAQQTVLEVLFGVPLSEMGFEVPSHRYARAWGSGDDGEVKRREFVNGTGAIAASSMLPSDGASRVGALDVAATRARLADLYAVDHRSGGVTARARARQLEQQVTAVLNKAVYTSRVGSDLQTILCEIACHCAWFGYDSGPLAEARVACTEALTAAQLIGSPLLQVRALNTFALLAVAAGRRWEADSAVSNAYALAQHAGAGPTVHLVISLREANAATHAGDLPRARRALSRALSCQGRADRDAEVPRWARFAGSVEIDYATAAYHAAEGKPSRAVPFLRSAVAGLGGGYTRNTAWYRARLANTLLDTGEVDEACREISGVLDSCGSVSSLRLRRRLLSFEKAVSRKEASMSQEIVERIREATGGGAQ
ncbi:hypothetical protein [Streptomyces buecherae]|uniref:hypothetical protein n=1 Tax=Streptomyces buecherae TaxID=2763006 RepID=UPI0020B8DE1A|nr:hypothetical protein [Streptomyces buecherae]